MRRTALPALLALATALPAQVGPTLLDSPGSQANTPQASLVLVAQIPVLGLPGPSPFLSATDVSRSLVWTVSGGPFPPSTLLVNASVQGSPSMPLAFAVCTSQVPANVCSVSSGPLCPGGAQLLANATTPAGLLHLTPDLLPLFDGFTPGAAFPATTNGSGLFAFDGSRPLSGGVAANTFHEAYQALLADPASPSGLRLTAAFTIVQWILVP